MTCSFKSFYLEILTQILVKPRLNALKEATPLVLNKESSATEELGIKVEQAMLMLGRYTNNMLPILTQWFTDTLPTHFRYYRG